MSEDVEVTHDPVAEAQDRADEIAKEKVETESPLETIRPSAEPKTRVVGVGDEKTEYVQKPLSFFGKMDFYSLVGETLDAAMTSGMSLDALFDDIVPGVSSRDLSAADFGAADQLMKTIAKLARFAPQLLIDSYTIWLDVPLGDRQWFKETVVKSVDEGGLSDEEGIDILNVFIAQNAEAIEAFFTKHLPLVSKTYRESRGGKSS